MIKADRPIKYENDDLLNRGNFVNKFASSLFEYDSREPIVVGINGSWGCGKTSLVNLIIDKAKSMYNDNEKELLALFFEPWNYSDVSQLITQYFSMMSTSLANSKDKALEGIGSLLEKYGQGLGGFIPSAVIQAASKTIPSIGALVRGKTIYGSGDLASQRKLIIERLEKYTGKIIVVIDDIDRLPFDQIREIFRLVAAVANFPNTIFILSFDRGIVGKALDVEQGSGDEYIEKIVQLPIEIPPVTRKHINEMFNDVFGEYVNPESSMIWQQDYWFAVVDYILGMITNLRDIIRLSNTVELKMSMVGEEVNFTDMLLLTSIEIKQHKLYKWIYSNKDRLTGGTEFTIHNYGKKPETEKTELINEIESLELQMETNLATAILSAMFPRVASFMNRGWGIQEDTASLRRNQRIASPNKFDRYFVMSIEESQINRRNLNQALEVHNVEDLILYIKECLENNQEYELFEELRALSTNLNYAQTINLAQALIETFAYIDSSNANSILSSKSRAEYLILDLFNRIRQNDEKIIYQIIEKKLNIAKVEDLEIIAKLLHHEALAYGVIPTPEREGYRRFITEDEFNILSKRYIDKALELDKESSLLNLESSNISLDIIGWLASEEYSKYLERKLKDDINVLRYVVHNIVVGATTTMSGTWATYLLNEELRQERFIKNRCVDNLIEKSISDGAIMQFSPEEVIKLAAFTLRSTADYDRDMGVSEHRCLEVVEEWEKKLSE